jgi:hypothetical protein
VHEVESPSHHQQKETNTMFFHGVEIIMLRIWPNGQDMDAVFFADDIVRDS